MSSTPVGTYPLSVTGSSAALSHTVVVTLTVATSAGSTTASLGPTTLTFGPQASGTTSSPQAIQLTNTGAGPLSISSISITGQNSGDFAQSNTCGNGIAAGANCQISVTFTPTGMGARNATISVSDNATGSPQMASLNGVGPDFSMSAGSTQTVSVPAGQTATYVLTLALSAAFNQNVTFSCAGNPALTSCSLTPNPLSLNGTGSVTTTVTVTTTAATHGFALPLGSQGRMRTDYKPQSFLLGVLSILVFIVVSLIGRRRNPRFRWAPVGAFSVLLLVATAITSCGGGGSGGSSGSPGTQAGTYALTITASSSSGSSTVMHTTKLTLVVQ